jgi:Mce-associated membrane protein
VEVAVPPAHDQPAGLTESPHDDPTRSTTFRLALAGVLALILLLSLGASVWLAATRGFEAVGIDRGAGELQTERDEVMSQTRQFMLRMGTYGPDQLEDGQLPEYRRLVTEVITPKFATSFDQSVTTAEQIVAKAGVSREAEVFSAGVSTIDADSATALVAGTFTDSYPDNSGELRPQEPVPFRIQVTLVKTEGEWLVDDFTPVTGAEE